MPEQVVTTSEKWSLNVRDYVQTFLMAAIGAAITAFYEVINKIIINGGGFGDINWKTIGLVALAAGFAQIIRKLPQPTVVVVTNPTKTEVKAVKAGDAEVEIKKPDA